MLGKDDSMCSRSMCRTREKNVTVTIKSASSARATKRRTCCLFRATLMRRPFLSGGGVYRDCLVSALNLSLISYAKITLSGANVYEFLTHSCSIRTLCFSSGTTCRFWKISQKRTYIPIFSNVYNLAQVRLHLYCIRGEGNGIVACGCETQDD